MSNWYIVKTNWDKIIEKCPLYGGLGGDVWPIESNSKNSLKELHRKILDSRTHVSFESSVELLCTNYKIAEEYYLSLKNLLNNVWFLEVSNINNLNSNIIGLDIGYYSGGYSIIESELIIQSMKGPSLNKWGLFYSLNDALEYSDMRSNNEELEEIVNISPVYIGLINNNLK
jgi:hypothetical protein